MVYEIGSGQDRAFQRCSYGFWLRTPALLLEGRERDVGIFTLGARTTHTIPPYVGAHGVGIHVQRKHAARAQATQSLTP